LRNEIDSLLRQNQTQHRKGPLAFKVQTKKTWLAGGGEHSRPSGVLCSAPSSFREEIHLEVSIEEQANRWITKGGDLKRIFVGPSLIYAYV
jgi:hypothetical protein